jgi:hypothetical protein
MIRCQYFGYYEGYVDNAVVFTNKSHAWYMDFYIFKRNFRIYKLKG